MKAYMKDVDFFNPVILECESKGEADALWHALNMVSEICLVRAEEYLADHPNVDFDTLRDNTEDLIIGFGKVYRPVEEYED